MTASLANLLNRKENKVAECLERILALSEVVKVIIYGSFAKGSTQADSDLDVAVFFDTDDDLLLEQYRKLCRICSASPIDIQIQAFSRNELDDPCGIVEEIVQYGIEYNLSTVQRARG